MRRRSWFGWTLLIGAGALVACGGDDSEGASGTGGSVWNRYVNAFPCRITLRHPWPVMFAQ